MSPWIDPNDAPLLTPGVAAHGECSIGDKLIRPATHTITGRPLKGDTPKRQVTHRLDAQVLNHFRAEGPGWLTRINEALRRAAKLP